MPRRSRPPRQEQADLARLAVARRDEVGEFENGGRMPFESDLTAIRAALEAHGAIFIDENGEGPGDRVPKKRRGWAMTSLSMSLSLAAISLALPPNLTANSVGIADHSPAFSFAAGFWIV
jgi:hypothetical protein